MRRHSPADYDRALNMRSPDKKWPQAKGAGQQSQRQMPPLHQARPAAPQAPRPQQNQAAQLRVDGRKGRPPAGVVNQTLKSPTPPQRSHLTPKVAQTKTAQGARRHVEPPSHKPTAPHVRL